MGEHIRKMFDEVAGRYDFLNHFMSGGRDKIWRKKASALVQQNDGFVLDICGGTGDFFHEFCKLHSHTTGIVGDFSGGMLVQGYQKYPEYKWVRLDAQKLCFANNVASVVLNGFGMRNVIRMEAALQEAYRVLQPGGVFITLEFFKPDNVFSKVYYTFLAPVIMPLCGLMARSKASAYSYLAASIKNFLTAQQYAQKAQEIGFELQKIQSFDFGLVQAVLLRKPE
jgi:demethylmenaquinone methyltransferase / 2-methoxy-6-polyprenyl-1,4-benzoquinol methylase